MALADFCFKLDERCRLPPSTDLPATVWKWALPFAKIKNLFLFWRKCWQFWTQRNFYFQFCLKFRLSIKFFSNQLISIGICEPFPNRQFCLPQFLCSWGGLPSSYPAPLSLEGEFLGLTSSCLISCTSYYLIYLCFFIFICSYGSSCIFLIHSHESSYKFFP